MQMAREVGVQHPFSNVSDIVGHPYWGHVSGRTVLVGISPKYDRVNSKHYSV